MERYKFIYDDHKEVHEVQDIFHFNILLNDIDKHFKQLFKWDYVHKNWKEVTR